jgi:hypothetical protein
MFYLSKGDKAVGLGVVIMLSGKEPRVTGQSTDLLHQTLPILYLYPHLNHNHDHIHQRNAVHPHTK